MNVEKLYGQTLKPGIVISKRKQSGVFKSKYKICVRFDEAFNYRTKANKVEYTVDASRYNYIIIGARVQASFSQAPEGYQPMGFFY